MRLPLLNEYVLAMTNPPVQRERNQCCLTNVQLQMKTIIATTTDSQTKTITQNYNNYNSHIAYLVYNNYNYSGTSEHFLIMGGFLTMEYGGCILR